MLLTYIFQSCFVIENEETAIIIDFYNDSFGTNKKGYINDTILKSNKKIYCLASHSHYDHYNEQVLNWNNNIKYFFSYDIRINDNKKYLDITTLNLHDEFKDNDIYIKSYGSTDLGISFYIEFDNKKIFHSGDLNNWHWNEEADEEHAKQYEKDYLEILDKISTDIKHLDLLMFPLDKRLGKEFEKGAKQFLDKITIKTFAPMHFWGNFESIINFKNITKEKNINYICWKNYGESISL